MKKLALLLALALVAPLAALADQGQWQAAHIEKVICKRYHGSGTVADSLDPNIGGFWLERGAAHAGLKSLGAGYDTTCFADTLANIDISDCFAFQGALVRTAGTGDSLHLGDLVIEFDPGAVNASQGGLLGSADSILVATDFTYNGTRYFSQLMLESDAKGGLVRVGGDLDGATMVVKPIYVSILNKPAQISNKTVCDCMGAIGLRFRLGVSWETVGKKVKRVTFNKIVGGPERGF